MVQLDGSIKRHMTEQAGSAIRTPHWTTASLKKTAFAIGPRRWLCRDKLPHVPCVWRVLPFPPKTASGAHGLF